MSIVIEALLLLRPNVEFSITNDDLSTLIWHTENVTPVTQNELDLKIEEINSIKTTLQIDRLAKIQSAINKLKALGLTEEEAKAIAGI